MSLAGEHPALPETTLTLPVGCSTRPLQLHPCSQRHSPGPDLPSPSSGQCLLRALSGSREPELLPPRNHNPRLPCQTLRHFQVSGPARERCCWTTVRSLWDGCCRQQPASDAGLCWKITCQPSAGNPSILLHPKQIPAVPAASPTSSSISSLRKSTPVTAPHSRPSQPAFQEQTRMYHGAKLTLVQRAEPSPGHPTQPTAGQQQPGTRDHGLRSSQQQQTRV